MGMNGQQLFEWLQAIPKEQLEKSRIILEVGRVGVEELTTAKFHVKGEPQPTIYLIHK